VFNVNLPWQLHCCISDFQLERERVPEKSWCAVASLTAETLMLSGNTQLKKEPVKEKIG
jgi:hypothetical protein